MGRAKAKEKCCPISHQGLEPIVRNCTLLASPYLGVRVRTMTLMLSLLSLGIIITTCTWSFPLSINKMKDKGFRNIIEQKTLTIDGVIVYLTLRSHKFQIFTKTLALTFSIGSRSSSLSIEPQCHKGKGKLPHSSRWIMWLLGAKKWCVMVLECTKIISYDYQYMIKTISLETIKKCWLLHYLMVLLGWLRMGWKLGRKISM